MIWVDAIAAPAVWFPSKLNEGSTPSRSFVQLSDGNTADKQGEISSSQGRVD